MDDTPFWYETLDRAFAEAHARLIDRFEDREFVPWFEYANDPEGFIVNVLGERQLYPKQQEICRSVVEDRWLSIISGKGRGKTWLMARLVLWFLYTRKNGIVITSATTHTQLETQLWAEIRDAFACCKFELPPGDTNRMSIEIGPKWFALGRSPRDPQSVAGYHPKAVNPEWEEAARTGTGEIMVVCDEASGVPDDRMEALQGLCTTPGSIFVMVGNPALLEGALYRSHNPTPGQDVDKHFALHHIGIDDVPSWILDEKWVERVKNDCGPNYKTHPRWRVEVLGLFPLQAENLLFPRTLLEQAAEIRPAVGGRHIGVDIARHGGDACVASMLDRGRLRGIHRWGQDGPKLDLVETAHQIRALCLGDTWAGGTDRGWDVEPRNVHVDATGMGAGVCDMLWQWGIPVDAVEFGEGPQGDWRGRGIGKFPYLRNRRQELHWIAKRCLEEGLLSIPEDPKYGMLWSDMMAVRYAYDNSKDAFTVESKEQFRKRVGRSPDDLDSVLCALSRTNPMKVRIRRLGRDKKTARV